MGKKKFDNAKQVDFYIQKEDKNQSPVLEEKGNPRDLKIKEDLLNENLDLAVTFKTSKKLKVKLNLLAFKSDKGLSEVINEAIILGIEKQGKLNIDGE